MPRRSERLGARRVVLDRPVEQRLRSRGSSCGPSTKSSDRLGLRTVDARRDVDEQQLAHERADGAPRAAIDVMPPSDMPTTATASGASRCDRDRDVVGHVRRRVADRRRRQPECPWPGRSIATRRPAEREHDRVPRVRVLRAAVEEHELRRSVAPHERADRRGRRVPRPRPAVRSAVAASAAARTRRRSRGTDRTRRSRSARRWSRPWASSWQVADGAGRVGGCWRAARPAAATRARVGSERRRRTVDRRALEHRPTSTPPRPPTPTRCTDDRRRCDGSADRPPATARSPRRTTTRSTSPRPSCPATSPATSSGRVRSRTRRRVRSGGWCCTAARSVAGDPIAVSGVVVAPIAPPAGAPHAVLTWAHGTTGLARRVRAVDARAAGGGFSPRRSSPRWPSVAGWTFVATDYEGLGTPGVHPYLVGQSEGRGVLDIVRAAAAARGQRRHRVDSPVAIFGHSQGGHAALMAGEIAGVVRAGARRHRHGRGCAARRPAVDRERDIAGGAVGGFGLMVNAGFLAAYPDLPVDAVADDERQRRCSRRSATPAPPRRSSSPVGSPRRSRTRPTTPSGRRAPDENSPGDVVPGGAGADHPRRAPTRPCPRCSAS